MTKLTQEQIDDLKQTETGRSILRPGILVVYKGGGYDGCIWEWNTFVTVGVGELVNVHSSGHDGIWERHQNSKQKEFRFGRLLQRIEDGDIEMMADLTVREGCQEINGFIACYALAVAKRLDDLDLSVDGTDLRVELKCCECGKYSSYTPEMRLDHGYDHGDGGVGVVNDHLVCDDCYSKTQCSYCEERMTDDELNNGVLGKLGACSCCVDKAIDHFSDEDDASYTDLKESVKGIDSVLKKLLALDKPEALKEKWKKQAAEMKAEMEQGMANLVELYLK